VIVTALIPARIAYAALGGGSAPVWIAREAGIFEDEGVDAEVLLVRGSGRVTEALVANEVQFGNFAAPLAVEMNRKGGDLVFLTGGLNWIVQMIIGRPEIEAASQLRGKTFGIAGGTGGVDHLLVPYLLQRYGVDFERDMQTRTIESQPDAIEKMAAGEIDAALFSPPYAFEATKRGNRILIDGGDLRIDYQLGGIVASRAFVAENQDLTRRVVRAYVRGVHRYKTDADYVVGILRQYSLIEDENVARQTHATQNRFFQPVPYPSVRGIQAVIDQTTRGAESSQVQPEAMVDARWVGELEHSGFIRDLYANAPELLQGTVSGVNHG
jgi:NitT/TauT family transport system substrate-binding protein